MKEFVGLRAKTYAYALIDDDSEKKKAKGIKKCVIRRKTMFENYTDCLFNDKIKLKLQQVFRSNHHNVYTEEINKIALNSSYDKRLQTLNRVTTYPQETIVFKVCKSEMIIVRDFLLKITEIVHFMMKSYYNHNKDKRLQM